MLFHLLCKLYERSSVIIINLSFSLYAFPYLATPR